MTRDVPLLHQKVERGRPQTEPPTISRVGVVLKAEALEQGRVLKGDPSMLALVVRFAVKQGCTETFDELVAQTLDAITKLEPDTLVYLTSVPVSDAGVRVFLEVYRDQTAFERHEQQPHVKAFLKARDDLVDSVRVDRLIDVSGRIAVEVPQ